MLIGCAANLEVLKRLTGTGVGTEQWYDLWKSVPGVPEPPLPIEDVDEAQRMWLAIFGAVPRRDYDNLKGRLAVVEEECEKLRSALNQVTQAMTGLKNLPETMAPWLQLAQMTINNHMDWLSELGKSWQADKDSRPASEDTDCS